MASVDIDPGQAARRDWMSLLAKAERSALEAAWTGLADKPDWQWLRKPETGLVMVRGRAGGTGAAFNLGEMTVTRCALRTDAGHSGHAYVAGRDREHARLAALFDALLQDEARRSALTEAVLTPIAEAHAAGRRQRDAETAATKVEFFTMVRGED